MSTPAEDEELQRRHEQRVRDQDLAYSVIVRNLRRRLWKAFQEDDVNSARRAYAATASDLEQWILEEEHEEQRIRQQQEHEQQESLIRESSNDHRRRKNELHDKQYRHSCTSLLSKSAGKEKKTTKMKKKQARDHSTKNGFASTTTKEKSTSKLIHCRRSVSRDRTDCPSTNSFLRACCKVVAIHADSSSIVAFSSNDAARIIANAAHLTASPYYSSDSNKSIYQDEQYSILRREFSPSDPFIADDFLSPHDDSYDSMVFCPEDSDDRMTEQQSASTSSKKYLFQRQKIRRPKLAAFNIFGMMLGKSGDLSSCEDNRNSSFDENVFANQENDTVDENDTTVTTPLHEAARLGCGEFVKLLLDWGGDANAKNGQSRTALHMVAGGVTVHEDHFLRQRNTMSSPNDTNQELSNNSESNDVEHATIGIRAPSVITSDIPPDDDGPSNGSRRQVTAKKAAKTVSRMFKSALRSSVSYSKERHKPPLPPREKSPPRPPSPTSCGTEQKQELSRNDHEHCNRLINDRMDATLALLSWTNPDSQVGPSINAVDADGRTALHYAAEMGRSDICMAILSNFGAMLTIVDELGSRTPCELAARHGHAELAAQLEARAVLYADPYGLDDELMAAVLTTIANEYDESDEGSDKSNKNDRGQKSGNRAKLVPPFNWFETLLPDQVNTERQKRIQHTLKKMRDIIKRTDCCNDMKTIMSIGSQTEVDSTWDGVPKDVDMAVDDDSGSQDSSSENEGNGEKRGHGKKRISNRNTKRTTTKSIKSDTFSRKPDESECHIDVLRSFLNLHEGHVDAYLSYHKWDTDAALEMFRKDPFDAFAEADIQIPCLSVENRKESTIDENCTNDDVKCCLICYTDDVEASEWIELEGCDHGFCSECVKGYLSDCAASKSMGLSVTCPHHECQAPLTQAEIESVFTSNEMVGSETSTYKRLVATANENFVSSASDLKFCPFPGCCGVVRRVPQSLETDVIMQFVGAVCTADPALGDEKETSECSAAIKGCSTSRTYEGIIDQNYMNCKSSKQPRKSHRFCFACGEDMHWPVTCDRLDKWNRKIHEEVSLADDDNNGAGKKSVDELAQKMWLKANTRPCPQCNVPIEKNDGCNHMTCTNPSCRHEFCWICRKDWKIHGTATGGFFRCNIWQEDEGHEPVEDQSDYPEELSIRAAVIQAAIGGELDANNDQGYGTAIHSARAAWKQKQEMARFLHHYTRWNAHSESAALERKMGENVCERLAPVVEAAIDFDGSPHFNFGGQGLSFVHAAFTELLECRSVLQNSYAFSFFRYPPMYSVHRYGHWQQRRQEKMAFERLQSELEMITEQMSDIVARSHLRATQFQITFLTTGAAEKRIDFTNLMFRVLNEERREECAAKQKELAHMAASNASFQRRNDGMSSRLDEVGQLLDDASPAANARTTTRESSSSVADSDSEHRMVEALRASLYEFLSNGHDEDDEDDDEEDEHDDDSVFDDTYHDGTPDMWACSACTYMNSHGRHCAMCGTYRVG